MHTACVSVIVSLPATARPLICQPTPSRVSSRGAIVCILVVYMSMWPSRRMPSLLQQSVPKVPISHACRTIKRLKPTRLNQHESTIRPSTLILPQGCTCHPPVQFRLLNAPACITYVLSCPSCASLFYIAVLSREPSMPRCHASHCLSLSCSVVLPALVVLAELAEEHPSTWGCLLAYYYNTTATSPHYMYLCYCTCTLTTRKTHTLTYAGERRIYNIRSARLRLAFSLPPASRPQYRVAAQYNTAAGYLHVARYTRRP